ncbi:MAG: hypothetical protein IH986_01915 [Planctomycetes bacterium]|nr:hypothetical protein [Planctomycetota bacterium]
MVLIDKGRDGYPVATQVIFGKGLKRSQLPRRRSVPDPDIDFENLMLWLFFKSTEMLRFNEARQQRRGNELIQEALGLVSAIPANQVEFVAAG